VELPLAAAHVNKPFALALDVVPTPTTYYAVVNVASVNVPSSPVTATLAIDQAYLDQYNADQLAADSNYVPYEMLPDSVYSIASFDATIPAGQRLDSVPITINTSKLALSGHKYVLPITIKSASVNISNWNHLMINVTGKNQYDGSYTNTYSGDLGDGTNTEKLTTVSATMSHTGLIGVYSNDVYIDVDPSTNNVTVLDATDGSNSTTTDPSSHYDPATRTFYLKYAYYGSYNIVQTLVRK
jgi:hypothetical protein